MAAKDPELAATCADWSSSCQLDLLVLMGAHTDEAGAFARQLAFVPAPGRAAPALLPKCAPSLSKY
eukprot:8338804-Pyramimonas_sp.AAC.1